MALTESLQYCPKKASKTPKNKKLLYLQVKCHHQLIDRPVLEPSRDQFSTKTQ